MDRSMKTLACVITCFSATAGMVSSASSQTSYPSKRITIVVPFAAGGSSPDIVGRMAAPILARELKVPVIVENELGAGGNLGAMRVAKAPADGHTLLMTTASFVTSPAMYTNPGFDPIRDFSPVTLVFTTPVLYTISNSLPATSVREFVDYAKKHPGQIAYGSAGIGSSSHLAVELFFDVFGINGVNVPYKGTSQAMPDLISGRIQFFAVPLGTVLPYLKDKRIKALTIAIGSKARLPQIPDVPTTHESVAPNFEVGFWGGMLAPAGTPAPIVNRLQSILEQYFTGPEGRAKLDTLGAIAVVSKPDEFSAYLKSERERWGKVIEKAGIKPQ